MINHSTIERDAIVERYVTGRLGEEHALRFEEHYLDCPQCIEAVEAAERLQRGLEHLSPESLPAGGIPALMPPPAPRPWAWVGGALAAMLVAALGVALVVQLREAQRLRSELEIARSESQVPITAPDPTVEGTEELEAELRIAQQQRAEAEARWQAEVQERESLDRRLEAWRAPVAALPLTLLAPLRGADQAFPVEIPAEGRWIGLWIELGGDEATRYRATLQDPQGQLTWQGSDLRLNTLGALLVQLPVDLLQPGSWQLVVESAWAPGEAFAPLATFPLKLRPAS